MTNTSTNFKQNLYFGKRAFFAIGRGYVARQLFSSAMNPIFATSAIQGLREHGRDLGTETKNYQLEWNHRADNWLNEPTIGYFKSATGTPRITDAPEIKLTTASINGGDDALFGGHSFQQTNQQKDWNFRNSFTYTGFDGTRHQSRRSCFPRPL